MAEIGCHEFWQEELSADSRSRIGVRIAMKKYYILKINGYDGEGSSLTVSADGKDTMYVVLLVDGSSAEIVDWGYSSVVDLIQAWSNVQFENASDYA